MKLTKNQLRKIIKEEIDEMGDFDFSMGAPPIRRGSAVHVQRLLNQLAQALGSDQAARDAQVAFVEALKAIGYTPLEIGTGRAEDEPNH
jgi:hypothetical protein